MIFLRKTPIYFSRKKHSPRGKDFKMTCITTPPPHLPTAVEGISPAMPNTLLDSGTFPPPNPDQEDPTGSAPAGPRLGESPWQPPIALGCHALSKIHPITLQPTPKWLPKKVTESES